MRLARIVRHPVKSVGFEEIGETVLTAGEVLPGDRRWAIAHAAARFGAAPDGWAAKLNFVRGWGSPGLMAVSVESLGADLCRFAHPDLPALTADLGTGDGRAALRDWVRPLWPEVRPEPAAVVQVAGQAMTDQKEPFVSILSLSSLAALGAAAGRDLSIHRFRGNLWIDGATPWSEWDWIGRDIGIGAARLRAEARITRCRATHANPQTGIADVEILDVLDRHHGHQDFGVFARVIEGGPVRAGDPVRVLT